ncbi:MAG: methionine adenosyltransferase [Kiritimatiellia bacterium]
MSKLPTRHVFSCESVSEGHPDKVADQISDAVLDACLDLDPKAHVACETACGPNLVVNLGEISGKGCEKLDTKSIAAEVIKEIGYNRPEEGFSYDTFNYLSALHNQSPDIAQGVNRGKPELQGAGDQGMMFGYATDETPEFMPAPLVWSHKLLERLSRLRKKGDIDYLRPDAKAQIGVLYENGKPVSIESIVISHQTLDVPLDRIRQDLVGVAYDTLPKKMLGANTKFYVNPTGKFVVGGPCGDSGVTGRKIIVDTYGGVGAHGGGAFSGKDPSKVDRSAAYYARYVAKNIVAAKLASKCEIQVAYAIGVAKPLSINISTCGTGKLPDEQLAEAILKSGLFDFRPAMIIQSLGLLERNGWRYRQTCNYGHFGRKIFPWEKTDKVDALKELLPR